MSVSTTSTFLAELAEDISGPTEPTTPQLPRLDVGEVDTVVVPAREEGFKEVFMGENRWYAIRIHGSMRPQIKHIAAYQVHSISAITHIAAVRSIEPWLDTGKFVIYFSEPAKEIGPIPLVKGGQVMALQNIRYTTREKLLAAKSLDDIW